MFYSSLILWICDCHVFLTSWLNRREKPVIANSNSGSYSPLVPYSSTGSPYPTPGACDSTSESPSSLVSALTSPLIFIPIWFPLLVHNVHATTSFQRILNIVQFISSSSFDLRPSSFPQDIISHKVRWVITLKTTRKTKNKQKTNWSQVGKAVIICYSLLCIRHWATLTQT